MLTSIEPQDPDAFRPDRFLEANSNPEVEGWQGYRPELMGQFYPNEVHHHITMIIQ